MISLLILLLLAWNFYIGYHRGIILQTYYVIASLISLGIAIVYYERLANVLTLWIPYSNASENASVAFFKTVNLFELDQVFYAGLAFFTIYVLVYFVFRLLGIFVHLMKTDRFNKETLNYFSGAMAVLVTMLTVSLFLNVLAAIPMSSLQNILSESLMIRLLIDFPLFSWFINYFWVTTIVK
ncbi:CvpA family protein [Streptococcus mutans]|uniref:CvpA family protein n=1 Tax=Streptococcus mutans TaxID=1309 RepID=UPI0028E7AC37|nr:CvpA family protein [Streptococcus mutans]MDT9522045.1 CvpA family protein [Streptococcus mutans]